MRSQPAEPPEKVVHPAFEGKHFRQAPGAQVMDHQKGVLPVLSRHVISIAVHVFTGDGQLGKMFEHVPTDVGQVG